MAAEVRGVKRGQAQGQTKAMHKACAGQPGGLNREWHCPV